MKYTVKNHENGEKYVHRDNDDGTWSHIPMDEGNQDYTDYLKKVKDGMEVVDETVKVLTLEEEVAQLQESLALKQTELAKKQLREEIELQVH